MARRMNMGARREVVWRWRSALVALLAEIRLAQDELGERTCKRGLAVAAGPFPADPLGFARSLGTTAKTAEVRATHRRPKRRYNKRIRMPSKLDPHLATTESWLGTEPQITALAIVRRLAAQSSHVRR